MKLRAAAAGIALGETANAVGEPEGPNRGPKIREYARNAGFESDGLPWCAMGVQWCADQAARLLRCRNPLDAVELEGLVESYALEAADRDWIVDPHEVEPGDLALFEFELGPPRWNHVGFVLSPPGWVEGGPDLGRSFSPFWTVEGNTGPGTGPDAVEADREGDGWYVRRRRFAVGRTLFLRWDELQEGPGP